MSFSTSAFTVYAMLALIATLLISSSAVLGQDQNAGQPNPSYSGTHGAVNPNTVDDATLKRTAKAYVKVRQIVRKAQQALNSSGNDAQKQQIAEQAESRKLAVVKDEGLQPQQYNQAILLAQADKAVQQKFLSYVNEVKNSPNNAE